MTVTSEDEPVTARVPRRVPPSRHSSLHPSTYHLQPAQPLLTSHRSHPPFCRLLWPSPALWRNQVQTNESFWSRHRRKVVTAISSHRDHHMSLRLLITTCLLLFLVFASVNAQHHWQETIEPRSRVNHLKDFELFVGNDSSIDYFKYLDRDGESLLIGARNFVYNISLSTLKENRRLEWSSSTDDIRMCQYKGKSEEVCQNYIKVLAKLADDRILVCGTNAFRPKCRSYQYGPMHNFLVLSEKSGEAICPYDPSYSSTSTFFGSFRERTERNLYVATVAGFTGADPLIYREPLRTEQFNPKHLNAPTFVSSLPHNGHVYFFFRETAVEYMNCGKAIFSRVARVCARDNGGPHKFRARWTSFLKARLNCSIPGDFPFYFDEIQATSEIVKGQYGGRNEQIVYAVFNTPRNSIGGSAVCAFRMEDIEAAFRGPFKSQKDIDSNWLPVPASRVPLGPRPGECSNDSQSLPELTLNFLKEHPLMDHTVGALWEAPVLVRASYRARFTAIAIDPQIETTTGQTFDVLFIGTDNGTVIKAINSASSAASGHQMHNSVVPTVIEEIVVFPGGAPVTQLIVHHTYYNAKLIVISPDEIKSIRLHRCQAKTCGECVHLQDPYCSFDLQQQKCTSARSRYWPRDNYVQNVELGWDPRCPDGRPGPSPSEEMPATIEDDMDPGLGPGPSAVPIYSSETFALAVVTSVVTSLVFGFIIGYIFSRRCRKEDPGICSPYDDPHSYLDPHNTFAGTLATGAGLTRLTSHGGGGMGALYGAHGTLEHPYSSSHGAGPHGNMGTLFKKRKFVGGQQAYPEGEEDLFVNNQRTEVLEYGVPESTPRYGPLPSLARSEIQQQGSVPMQRRLRVAPPPAYSDLDDFETDHRAEEPRYQPMPLHSIPRRPLPTKPDSSNRGNTKRPNPDGQRNKHSRSSHSSSGSASGDYEDISQL